MPTRNHPFPCRCDKEIRAAELKATRHLAVIERDRGEFALADQHFTEAASIAAEISSEPDREEMMANILDMIGVMQLARGQLEEAKESFYSASERFRKVSDNVRLSKVSNHLGRTFELQQLFNEANAYFSKALSEASAARRLDERAHALFGLARIAGLRGRVQDARRFLTDAKAGFSELGDSRTLDKINECETTSGTS